MFGIQQTHPNLLNHLTVLTNLNVIFILIHFQKKTGSYHFIS